MAGRQLPETWVLRGKWRGPEGQYVVELESQFYGRIVIEVGNTEDAAWSLAIASALKESTPETRVEYLTRCIDEAKDELREREERLIELREEVAAYHEAIAMMENQRRTLLGA